MDTTPEKELIERLVQDQHRMRKAGCNLAMAATRVIRDYDGLHRLSLAVAAWHEAIAHEGGRPHSENEGHRRNREDNED